MVDDPRAAPRRSPWPSRCRGRGRPAASRRRSISAGRPPAMTRSARSIARPVLPVAVGPPMTTSGASVRPSEPPERVRPGVVDADRDQAPTSDGDPATWTSLFSRERPARWATPSGRCANASRDSAVPAASSSSWSWAARRHDGVDEDLRRPARPTPRLRSSPIALLDAEQLVQPAALLRRGHVVGQPRRRRARALAVGGREDLVVADGLEQPERRLVLGLGLAAEADDDVGRERDPGDRLADPAEPLEVVLDRVLAAHPAEHRVGARLDRQVQRLAHRRAVGHRLDQPVGQVPRVRGHEPQARDRGRAVGASAARRWRGSARRGRAGPRGPAAARPSAPCGCAPKRGSGARSWP